MKRSKLIETIGRCTLALVCMSTLSDMAQAATGCDGAGNCHVRSAASGAGTGADWTNACKDLTGSCAPARGVTYYVAAGNYGSRTLSTADSGSTVIAIRAATAATHGTATGWNAAYVGQAVFTAGLTFTTDYWVFSGGYRANTGTLPGDWTNEAGYGFKLDNSGKTACGADVSGGLGYGGPPYFVHDITIEYLDVNGSHPTGDSCNEEGMDFEGGSYNLTFQYNYIHNVGNANFFLRGTHGGNSTFGTGSNILIQYSYMSYDYSSSAVHGEGCSCSEGIQNFTIRYNYWADMVGTAYIATPSGASYNSGNSPNGPWYIYGNVFLATDANHCAVGDGMLAVFDATFTGDIFFYNNTIANLGTSFCKGQLNTGFGFGLGFTTPITTIHVQNNLWWNSDVTSIINSGTTNYNGASFSAPATWSYNSYLGTNSGSSDSDPNKQVNANLTPFISSGALNFALATNTSAWTPLPSPYNVDLKGVTRTSSRGAFEYNTGTLPFLPPTNPSITTK